MLLPHVVWAQKWCGRCTGKRSGEVCTCPSTVASCSCPPGAAPSPSCVFYSPRIQALLNGHRTEQDTTRDHWTRLDRTTKAEMEIVGEENRKYFDEVLVKHPEWGAFFTKFEDLEVGEKIGEGGQAEIFAVTSKSFKHPARYKKKLVAKVWKEGVSLKDLERQWPPPMLSKVARGGCEWPFKNIFGGAFIRDGEFKNRFAFVMERRWGDLRTLIDQKALELRGNNEHGPPFGNIKDVLRVIFMVAIDMHNMHEAGIGHRDIKASNVLLVNNLPLYHLESIVIDYECSMGIIGTGFWRAPEILEQVQKSVRGHELVFTKKADIYNFGMMCYEIITGCIPFEGHPWNDYSIVLRGERPKLPCDLNPKLKKLVVDCWQCDPQHRPTTKEILERLEALRKEFSLYLDIKLGF